MPFPASRRSEAPTGFDFTRHMRTLCDDLVARLPELSHIDMSRVAVCFCQTRKAVSHGMQASLTPLRFESGSLVTTIRRRRYTVQRLYGDQGQEMLYILSFYLPRFLHRPSHDRLVTVLHELWHIGPKFDGDLRRHEGRCYQHTGSKESYDAAMAVLADRWLAMHPAPETHEVLRHDFAALLALHGRIFGAKSPRPKLLPID